MAAPPAKTGLNDWSEQKNKVDTDKEEEEEEDGAEMDLPMKAFLRLNLWAKVKGVFDSESLLYTCAACMRSEFETASEQHGPGSERKSERTIRWCR